MREVLNAGPDKVNALDVLSIIRGLTEYDLGHHAADATRKTASYLKECVDTGKICMDNESGAAEALVKILEVMALGDIPKNYLSEQMDAVTRAELRAAYKQEAEI